MARALMAPVLVALLLYAALCLMMWLGQGSMIFLRQSLASGAIEAARRTGAQAMRIGTSDGVSLHGWLRQADGEGPAPLLLYFGGNAEEVSWMQGEFARYPHIHVATFNYRGYGLSDGEPGEAALVSDAVTLHDQLTARPGVDARRVILMGRSLGTGVAVQLAAARPVCGVVLVSPYDSLTAVAARAYGWLPVSLLMRHPFDSLSRAPHIAAPMLALSGEADSVVPPAHTERLVSAWNGPHLWVRLSRADHIDLLGHAAFWPAVTDFLREVSGAMP